MAIMLEPSRAFYMAVFGAMKRGAIAVPLFTLFGPDGVKLRVDDCAPSLIVTNAEKAPLLAATGARTVVADADFIARLERFEPHFAPGTAADALAIFQYTSGTTRELPEAVKHSHRSIVTLMVAALYGTGLRPGRPTARSGCGMVRQRSCNSTWRRRFSTICALLYAGQFCL